VAYAIEVDDMNLFRFALDLGDEYSKRFETDDGVALSVLANAHFIAAIGKGRLPYLVELIKRSGAGISLDDIIKKTGIEVKKKPDYYQGLSVHGKKREDWAKAGRGLHAPTFANATPPLLTAAKLGNLDALEWFMSDAPMRRYKEFAEQMKDDRRIAILNQAPGGFEKIISGWLSSRSKLGVVAFSGLHLPCLSKE
jgi:hypothetical protein